MTNQAKLSQEINHELIYNPFSKEYEVLIAGYYKARSEYTENRLWMPVIISTLPKIFRKLLSARLRSPRSSPRRPCYFALYSNWFYHPVRLIPV